MRSLSCLRRKVHSLHAITTADGHESFTEPPSDPTKPGKSHKDPGIDRLGKLLIAGTAQR